MPSLRALVSLWSLVGFWPGRRPEVLCPELLCLELNGPVDLGLASGLDSEGVVIVLVLANRDTHQDGSGHDHCRRDNIDAGSKPTMALLSAPMSRS